MESTMVIKVKYGDTLRRFNARVDENEKLDLDILLLREKILSLFNFPPDAELTLTYIDEDGDKVTLVDDDDLQDVMRQRLKFLRIDVQNNDKLGKTYARSSGSSTPLRSPRVQNPVLNINNSVAEVLKSVPEPLREALSRLSLDLASKAATSGPVLAELVESITKVGLSNLNPASRSQSGVELNAEASDSVIASPVTKDPNVSKDGGLKKVLPKSSTPGSTSQSVDLNLVPLSDSDLTGSTKETPAPAASNVRTGAPISSSDQPSNVDQPGAMDLDGNPPKECPFSGVPVRNESAGSYGYPRGHPLKRCINRDAMVVFHKGVRCDGCGVHPITGPRFKSKVKEDFDLCSICFTAMGTEADYIRMDRPVHYRHPRPLKGLYDHAQNVWLGTPAAPYVGAPASYNVLKSRGFKSVRPKLDSRFILDVNVLDGTMMAPSTPFTKIWRMHNSGSLVWPQGTQLVWIGGDKLSNVTSMEIEIREDGVPVEGEVDIAVDFVAPELAGRYISYWRMASPDGVKFGQRVWVLIQVDGSLKGSISDSLQGLNLNLPPEINRGKGPEIIDMNVQPIVNGSFVEPKPEKQVVDVEPKKEQELNFPINDNLLVGQGASASAPPHPQSPSTISYPIIDLTEDEVPAEASSAPIPSEPVSDKDDVEQTLLKELAEMGFRQVDLNKEILRMNEYNLEQSVDDLCGVSEWDPILEELQEMGFCDEEKNKLLLKKNNGSIKRVVMDLLTGEKA